MFQVAPRSSSFDRFLGSMLAISACKSLKSALIPSPGDMSSTSVVLLDGKLVERLLICGNSSPLPFAPSDCPEVASVKSSCFSCFLKPCGLASNLVARSRAEPLQNGVLIRTCVTLFVALLAPSHALLGCLTAWRALPPLQAPLSSRKKCANWAKWTRPPLRLFLATTSKVRLVCGRW